MNEPTPPLALRIREAARVLGISQRHLWELARRGDVPHVRVGRGRRVILLFPVTGLQAWLDSQSKIRTSEMAEGGGR
jgi:excisionase family DNA binding protein